MHAPRPDRLPSTLGQQPIDSGSNTPFIHPGDRPVPSITREGQFTRPPVSKLGGHTLHLAWQSDVVRPVASKTNISQGPDPEVTDVNDADSPANTIIPPDGFTSEPKPKAPIPMEFPNIRLTGESDVADRLAEFKEIQAAVKNLAEQGALENVPDGIKYYLDRMVPAGVNRQGEVVRPENYRPEEMLPVLVVKPGEAVDKYKLRGVTEEARVAEKIIKSTGTIVSVSPEVLDRLVSSTLSPSKPAHIRCLELVVAPRDARDQPYPVYLPRLMVVSSGVLTENRGKMGLIMVHEADHWDFFHNIAPALRKEDGRRYSGAQLQSIAEKCAYESQHAVAQKLGHYDSIDSVEDLANPFKAAGIPPEYADSVVAISLEERLSASGVPEVSRMPLIVRAVTYTYGHPDTLITDEEVTAFRNIGLLAEGI